MITEQDITARAQQLVMRGIPRDAAISEARIELQHERAQLNQAARVKDEAEHPQVGFTFDRYDDLLRREQAQWNAAHDPQRIAMKAARRQQIEAQAQKLREQRDAVDRQLRALDDEWQANL